MRVDVHNHGMPEEALELLRSESSYGVELDGTTWTGPDGFVFEVGPGFTETEVKHTELAAKGIDAALISPAPPLFLYGAEPAAAEVLCEAVNSGLHRMAGHAEGSRWIANLPMADAARAAAMLEQVAARPGCVGVEVGTAIGERRLDHPEYDDFWAVAERLGTPVMIHPEIGAHRHEALDDFYLQNVIGFPLETTLAVERLIAAGVLGRHPGLRILLVHAGGFFPWQAGRLRHARTVRPELAGAPESPWDALGQVWFDVITHDGPALRYLADRVGLENVVLGTDMPFDMALPEPLELVESALGADAVEAVAERNPAALFNLD